MTSAIPPTISPPSMRFMTMRLAMGVARASAKARSMDLGKLRRKSAAGMRYATTSAVLISIIASSEPGAPVKLPFVKSVIRLAGIGGLFILFPSFGFSPQPTQED